VGILKKDITKLFLYFFASLLLAAVLSPPLYSAGKNLATQANNGELTGILKSIGESADRAKFTRYFNRALVFSLLVLLFPLMKLLRNKDTADKPEKQPLSKRLTPGVTGISDLLVGFTLAGGLLMTLGLVLTTHGWHEWKLPTSFADTKVDGKSILGWGSILKKSLQQAIPVAIIEELVFRGVLFGLLLRTMKPLKALVWLSLFFAAGHFLMPPKSATMSDPHAWYAGFELLGHIGLRFLNPADFIGSFITLFIVGAILANCAYLTGKLWLSIGLHAGWVFALKFYGGISKKNPELCAEPSVKLMIGDTIKDGVYPLLFLLATGILISFYLKIRLRPPSSE